MSKQNKHAKVLRLEGLENRTLMAGDVTVAVVSGVLEIAGDTADNSIQIKQSGAGWKVQGIGTTINGNNGAQTFTGVTGIEIDLGAGNDLIRATKGTLSGDLLISDLVGRTVIDLSKINASNIGISTFDQTDAITLNKCTATDGISIESFGTAQDGADTITVIKSSAGTTFDIGTGTGNDVITIKSATAGEAFVVGAFNAGTSDQDVVTITKSSSGDEFDVLTGDGPDTVTLSKVLSGADLRVLAFDSTGDNGIDTVSIVKSGAVGSLEIETGDGLDVVAVVKSTAGDDILISTGATANDAGDILTLTQLNAGNDIIITTGDGTDTATLSKVVAANELNVDMQEGNADRLVVARSRAVDAIFEGGDDDGDTLVQSRNVFGSDVATGFDNEIG